LKAHAGTAAVLVDELDARGFQGPASLDVYCGPVLRHPAELIQAANDMSVVTV
jgi:hypothetical protein